MLEAHLLRLLVGLLPVQLGSFEDFVVELIVKMTHAHSFEQINQICRLCHLFFAFHVESLQFFALGGGAQEP